MRKIFKVFIKIQILLFVFVASSCEKNPKLDLIKNPYIEEQAEILEVIESIVKDAETANIEGLQEAHLVSNKFTKFGPRSFDRQNVKSTNESEAAFFGSISDYKQEVNDLKIDVFGEIAIATYYPHVSFIQDGIEKEGSGRQTLVFLKTENTWKIVHEHGTLKK